MTEQRVNFKASLPIGSAFEQKSQSLVNESFVRSDEHLPPLLVKVIQPEEAPPQAKEPPFPGGVLPGQTCPWPRALAWHLAAEGFCNRNLTNTETQPALLPPLPPISLLLLLIYSF